MPDAQTVATTAKDSIEIIVPGLAGGGGAALGSLLGKPRTNRQHLGDVAAMTLFGLLVSPKICDYAGLTDRVDVCALCTIMGLTGPIVLRSAISILDEVGKQVEDGKSETAKGILGFARKLLLDRLARFVRTPDPEVVHTIMVPSPPTVPPVIIVASPPAAPPAAP